MSDMLRLSGLASGMDTEAVIKKLLSAQQTKVDSSKQKKQILEWKKDSYRNTNTKLLAVRSSLTNLKLPSTFNAKTVSSSDDKTVTATATGDAIPGIYTMKVKQVAQRVSLSSTSALGSSGDKSTIAKQFDLADTARIKFTIKGKDGEIAFDFAAKDANMKQIVDSINNQNTGLHASYDAGVDRFFLMSNDFGSNAEISVKVDSVDGTSSFLQDKLKLNLNYSTLNEGTPLSSHKITSVTAVASTPPPDTTLMSAFYSNSDETVPASITFTLQGKGSHDFTFNPTSTTLAAMVTSINAQTATTGITAAYDTVTGKMSLYNDVPMANLDTGSTSTTAALTFNEALYQDAAGTGTYTAIANGTDLKDNFTVSGTGGPTLTSAIYDSTTKKVNFTFSGPVADGASVILNNDVGGTGLGKIYDGSGNDYAPIAATYSGTTSSWSYTNTGINAGGQIAIRADANEFLGTKMQLNMSKVSGTGAKIDFNDAIDLEFDSNSFTLNNINFKVDPNAVVGTSATLTVVNDTEKAMTKIKAFVEAYNTAVSHIDTELKETRIYERHAVKYMPLTDEQKTAMSEDQIKQWETKAKVGLMKNESLLRSALANLRSITTNIIADKVADANVASRDELVDYVNVSGTLVSNCQYRSLAAIGISTGQYASGSTDNAKLYIDEIKLRAALETNAEDVEKLFTLTQTDTSATTTEEIDGQTYTRTLSYNIGIAAKLYDGLTDSMSQITSKAGSETGYYDNSLLAQDIYREDTRIKSFIIRMSEMEDRYYAQFANMEQVLQKLSAQGNWLQQRMSAQ